MKLVLVLSAVLSLAVAAPVADDPSPTNKTSKTNKSELVKLLSSENDNKGTGSYKFSYYQSDGQAHVQQGELKNKGREDAYIAVKGYYSWYSPDDTKYVIKYVADKNGFQQTVYKPKPVEKSHLTLDIISKLLT